MKRFGITIGLVVLVLTLLLAMAFLFRERRFATNRRIGEKWAAELKRLLGADPRFGESEVIGYSVRGGIHSARDYFYLRGWVGSKIDAQDLLNFVMSVQPPGRVSLGTVYVKSDFEANQPHEN